MLRSRLIKLFVFVTAAILTLLAVDNLLYFMSPLLPGTVVKMLSPGAQLRYIEANPDSLPWVYAENIRFGKPYAVSDGIKMDSLGYRNPGDYLERNGKIDILLLGDSFIWGTEQQTVADYLRDMLSPLTVYSEGIGGDGISQWRFHYLRFVSITGSSPRIVVLNFYSGNDLDNTHRYLDILREYGTVDSKVYFGYANESAAPQASNLRRLIALSELRHLAKNAVDAARDTDGEKATVPGRDKSYDFYIRREENPAALDDSALAQIAMTASQIRAVNPDTVIVLSYIPTSAALYGDSIVNCPNCKTDPETQRLLSKKLKAFSDSLQIDYLDPTPALQMLAKTKALWHGVHFSVEGYRAYSELLSHEIETILQR